jgi:hypothetical protein
MLTPMAFCGTPGRFASADEIKQLLVFDHESGSCGDTRTSSPYGDSDGGSHVDADEGACCSICHDQFSDVLVASAGGGSKVSSKRPVALGCGHIFCCGCLDEWLSRERTCPLCRASIEDAGPFPNNLSGRSMNLF